MTALSPFDPTDAAGRLADKRVVQCNYRVATSECKAGARAYVLDADTSDHRVRLLARSRGGRWIDKWENLRRLTSFRFKTIPPEHTLYGRVWGVVSTDGWLAALDEESAKPLGPDARP